MQPATGDDSSSEAGDGCRGSQDRGTHLRHGDARLDGGQQRHHTRHLRRRHRRARQDAVGATGKRRLDQRARRRQIDRRAAVVRYRRQRVRGGERGHGDHVRQAVVARIPRDGVVVRRLIAGGRHKRDTGIPPGTDCLLNDHRKAGRSLPTGIHGHDVDAVIPTHHRDIVDGLDDRARVADAATVLNLERHQRHLPADPGDTDAVVAHGPDDARDMGAVAVAIGHLVIVVNEVPAVDVVLIAVIVIVNGIA